LIFFELTILRKHSLPAISNVEVNVIIIKIFHQPAKTRTAFEVAMRLHFMGVMQQHVQIN